MLAHVRDEDIMVVASMDRLARSVVDLDQLVSHLTATGVYLGRARRLTPEQVDEARAAIGEGVPKAVIARGLGVARQTLYDALASAPRRT